MVAAGGELREAFKTGRVKCDLENMLVLKKGKDLKQDFSFIDEYLSSQTVPSSSMQSSPTALVNSLVQQLLSAQSSDRKSREGDMKLHQIQNLQMIRLMKGEGRNLRRRRRERLRNFQMKVLMIPTEGSQKERKETGRRRKSVQFLMNILLLRMILILWTVLMSVIMTHYTEHCRSQI